jgi:uncharacterized protein
MLHSESRVATEKPAPYMRQLCKHFGHKVETAFDDERGQIVFPIGRCDLDASRPGVLVIRAQADSEESLARTRDVVGSHLERFGRRDELSVSWN